VGIGTAIPNRRLHVYQTSGNNAEIDIQSVIGTERHWAIYQDRTSEDLNFWHTDGDNVLSVTNEGSVKVNSEICLNGDCISEWGGSFIEEVVEEVKEVVVNECYEGGTYPMTSLGMGNPRTPNTDLVSAYLQIYMGGDLGDASEYVDLYLWDFVNDTEEYIGQYSSVDSDCGDIDWFTAWEGDVTDLVAITGSVVIRGRVPTGVSDLAYYGKLTLVEAYTEIAASPTGAGLWALNDSDIYYDVGNVGIGTFMPNRRLHVYQTSGVNAEIDIQSVIGTDEHWAIYQDRTSEDLNFWHEDGDNVLSITNEGLVKVKNFATGDLPTCDGDVLGAIVFNTDEDAHYACTSIGWAVFAIAGDESNPNWQAAVINAMDPADGATELESMIISEAATIVNSSDLTSANAAAIFNHSNLSVEQAIAILADSSLAASKAASVLEHTNLDADRSQMLMYGITNFAKIIDIVTTGADDTRFAADGSITGVNRYGLLTIDPDVVLTASGQPNVIIASTLNNDGTIDKSKSGTAGGTSDDQGDGGDGGGGLVIIAKNFNNSSVIQANGENGENGGHWSSNGGTNYTSNGQSAGDSTIYRINTDTVGDGGNSGYYCCDIMGLGKFGGGGGHGSGSSQGGDGGDVIYVTYNNATELYTEQRKAVIDWWLINIAVKSPTVSESLVNASGAGGGGGGNKYRGYTGDNGGGGGSGGHILVIADVYNNDGTMHVNAGNGGDGGVYKYPDYTMNSDYGGGGAGGGIIYGLYRTTLTSEGALTALGGIKGVTRDDNYIAEDGTDGTTATYDVSF